MDAKKEYQTDWSRDELKAYVLLYCAHADFVESTAEKKLIIDKVGKEKYEAIHKEFDKDNDYQSIQKIQATLDRFDYSKEEIDELFAEIKEIFLADGQYETLERNIEMVLQHLFKE